MGRWIKILTLLLVLTGFQTADYNEVYWNENNQLSWDDYTIIPQNSGHYDALTATGIDFAYTDMESHIEVNISAFFDRSQSWVQVGSRTDALLAHEQLHFAISELYARKLRLAVTSNNIYGVDDLDRLYEKIANDMIIAQEQYDIETHHGLDIDHQLEWERMVYEELGETDFYSEPTLAISTSNVTSDW